jgi:hypothetical protein
MIQQSGEIDEVFTALFGFATKRKGGYRVPYQ